MYFVRQHKNVYCKTIPSIKVRKLTNCVPIWTPSWVTSRRSFVAKIKQNQIWGQSFATAATIFTLGDLHKQTIQKKKRRRNQLKFNQSTENQKTTLNWQYWINSSSGWISNHEFLAWTGWLLRKCHAALGVMHLFSRALRWLHLFI